MLPCQKKKYCNKSCFAIFLKGKTLAKESIEKRQKNRSYESITGKSCHLWKNGLSKEPYGFDFKRILKEQIRQRDNFRCQECFRHQDELRSKSNKPYKLMIHHIDFNKRNNNPNNLISLCRNCHTQTNFNREQWTKYFQEKMINYG